jgi:hypothetical protein
MYKSFKEAWDKAKKKYEYGKQYIDMETRQYIVICPFIPNILRDLNDELERENAKFHMCHCVCYSFAAFSMWYRLLYKDGRVKTFFIRKDINLDVEYHDQPLTAEFTGWVDYSNKNFLYFTHLVNNHAATGYYGNGSEFACEKCACSDKIDNTCKNEVEEVNNALYSIFDDLFSVYDKYVDELEDTLHEFLDKYYD